MASRKKVTQDLVAKPGCCEEASTLSGKFYIPCNRPAIAIVGWKGRSDKPIRMCEMCENHNIKNRGGCRVELLPSSPPAVQTPAPSGHNSDITDDALIAENFKIEDLIKAAQAKFNEWALPHKTRLAEIEAEISRRLLERNAKNTKTDSGTAYFSDIMSTKIENVGALFDFIADNWQDFGAGVKLSIPVGDAKAPDNGTVRWHMDNNDGNLPPGMSNSFYKQLNIKRS